MPRLIKRKQLKIDLQEPINEVSYGLSENRVNIQKGDKMELAFDKIATYLDTRSFVELKQIWTQSDIIPNVAQPIIGIIEEVINLQLNVVDGKPNQFSHPDLYNVIPEFFGDGQSYRYTVTTNNNDTIDLRSLHGYLDPTTGTLSFLNGNPTGVSNFSPPRISCFKYIGNTGEDGNFGNGNSNGGIFTSDMLGDWQDSVIDFIQVLPTNPTIGDRFIYNGTNTIQTCVLIGDEIKSGNIIPDDIITYMSIENSTSGTSNTSGTSICGNEGWFPYKPNNGSFTSIQNFDNTIYNWSISNRWKQYRDERTYPVELDMKPQDTFIINSGYSHIISSDSIIEDGTPNTDYNLFLNGIKIQDHLYDFINLNKRSLIYDSVSSNGIEFIGTDTPLNGDLIELMSTSGSIWRTVTDVVISSTISGAFTITYSGDQVSFNDVFINSISIVGGNYPRTGSYILLKDNIDYDIETGLCPDNICFNYMTPNFD